MISVLVGNPRRFRVSQKKILSTAVSFLKKNGVNNAEISVSIVPGEEMLKISQKYLGDKKPHAVLAFPLEDSSVKVKFPTAGKIRRLGDIVISYPLAGEISFLVEHACRHLLGKHHGEK